MTSKHSRAPLSPLPATLEPELATLVSKPPAGDWLYEIKYDGYRMLARVDGPDVRILTRRGNDWTSRFPTLRAALMAAKLPVGWYDGEMVLLDGTGMPTFNGLQNAIESGANADIVFYLFDAPFLAGHDLRQVPVEERRRRLQEVLQETDRLRFSQEIEGKAADLLDSACRLGLEGVIGKRRGSPYVHRRSDDWIKLKCTQRQEFVIGGFTWPDDSRANGIGALLVGYVDEGRILQYAGKVGTGYTGKVSAALRQRLDAMSMPKRPFAGPTGHDTHATWVRPELVCEVVYSEWPEGGSLRHASFKGLREPDDKPAAEVAPERPAKARTRAVAPPGKLRITHGERVIDPSTGLTKLDLATYYAQVARWMLPYLAGRHAYVVRFPTGIEGERIFQQHPQGMAGLRGTDPALWRGHEPAIAFESAEDLVRAAQLDCIEIHTWNSTANAIKLPDRVIFDLDPGDGVTWARMRQAAELVRVMLQELGLASWLKTSGGKGLHIVVPLKPELEYPTVKSFSEAVATHLGQAVPQLFVAKSGGRNRMGRIFVDYLRNGQSQSTAEAYSARARPGMGVSMPITWDQLAEVRSGGHWTVSTAIAYLRSRKSDPWGGYWRNPQHLAPAMQRLRALI
ncbi:DNA ligase D [Caenimonas sedimenti]|uniref:DNA ligase D n=1 Tax=Caenimonas sedimenti TaxID=2596921 RepID=UPI001646A8F4|nr:DNA ligase D [Caenimonas sedimenti]